MGPPAEPVAGCGQALSGGGDARAADETTQRTQASHVLAGSVADAVAAGIEDLVLAVARDQAGEPDGLGEAGRRQESAVGGSDAAKPRHRVWRERLDAVEGGVVGSVPPVAEDARGRADGRLAEEVVHQAEGVGQEAEERVVALEPPHQLEREDVGVGGEGGPVEDKVRARACVAQVVADHIQVDGRDEAAQVWPRGEKGLIAPDLEGEDGADAAAQRRQPSLLGESLDGADGFEPDGAARGIVVGSRLEEVAGDGDLLARLAGEQARDAGQHAVVEPGPDIGADSDRAVLGEQSPQAAAGGRRQGEAEALAVRAPGGDAVVVPGDGAVEVAGSLLVPGARQRHGVGEDADSPCLERREAESQPDGVAEHDSARHVPALVRRRLRGALDGDDLCDEAAGRRGRRVHHQALRAVGVAGEDRLVDGWLDDLEGRLLDVPGLGHHPAAVVRDAVGGELDDLDALEADLPHDRRRLVGGLPHAVERVPARVLPETSGEVPSRLARQRLGHSLPDRLNHSRAPAYGQEQGSRCCLRGPEAP